MNNSVTESPMKNSERPAYGPVGITKREYLTAMAMQGILASSADRGESAVAQMSIKFADELLKHLEITNH